MVLVGDVVVEWDGDVGVGDEGVGWGDWSWGGGGVERGGGFFWGV